MIVNGLNMGLVMGREYCLLVTALMFGCATNGGGELVNGEPVSKLMINNDISSISENKRISSFFEKIQFTVNSGDNFEKILFEKGIPPSTLFSMKNSDIATIKDIKNGDKFIISKSTKHNFFKIEKVRADKIIFSKTMIGSYDENLRGGKYNKSVNQKNKKVVFDGKYGFVSSGDIRVDCRKNGCSDRVFDIRDILDGHSEFSGFGRGDKLRFIDNGKRVVAADYISKNNRIIVFWDGGEYIYFSDTENRNERKERKVIDSGDPISPVYYTRISSRFDPSRFHPVLKRKRPHNGVDLAAKQGSPIVNVQEGRVSFVGNRGDYGKMILISHGRGLETVYGHMSGYKSGIKVGDFVDKGTVIGYVGSTGLATGPHLHYEVRVNKVPVDPTKISLSSFFRLKGYYQERKSVEITANIKVLVSELNKIKLTQ